MQSLVSNQSVEFTDISFQLTKFLNGTAVTIQITLPLENQTQVVTELLQFYSSSSFSMFGGYTVRDENHGIRVISASCESKSITPLKLIDFCILLLQLCVPVLNLLL